MEKGAPPVSEFIHLSELAVIPWRANAEFMAWLEIPVPGRPVPERPALESPVPESPDLATPVLARPSRLKFSFLVCYIRSLRMLPFLCELMGCVLMFPQAEETLARACSGPTGLPMEFSDDWALL